MTGVEWGHSSHRRLHFGKGVQSTREWPHSAPSVFPLFLLACALLVPRFADARTFVLKPDGTGDVATFQTGVDSILAPNYGPRDTLRVLQGYYDELVSIEPHADASIEGVGAVELRGMTGYNEEPSLYGSARLTIDGLQVRRSVHFGSNTRGLLFKHCLFRGEVKIERFLRSSGGIEDCVFLGGADVTGARCNFRRCHFSGQTARFSLYTDWQINIEDCVFEGGTDTAAVTRTNADDGIAFQNCVFRNVGVGIAATFPTDWKGYYGGRFRSLYINGCRFEDLSGPAIAVPPNDTERHIEMGIGGSRFDGCASAIDASHGPRLSLFMSTDTITACRGPAINACVRSIGLQSVIVRGSMGEGALLHLDNAWQVLVENCLFESNGSDGVRIEGNWNPDFPTTAIKHSTLVLNGGAGFFLQPPHSLGDLSVENNLFAGNEKEGLVIGPYLGHVQHNDSWLNTGQGYVGVLQGEPNLSVDPQLCDPLAGDYHVTSSSPCAPSGPFGQIGAFGVGCDAMHVGVDVEPRSANPINPRSSRLIAAAILGSPLFDTHRVDRASVRLAGAEPAVVRGSRRDARFEDVNRDGVDDLVMLFGSKDMDLAGAEIELSGRSIDTAPFHGSDSVHLVVKPEPAHSAAGGELMLEVPSPQRARRLQVIASAPAARRAVLELFDISGRRVVAKEISVSGDKRVIALDLAALHVGLYLMRVQAGNFQAVKRVVVIE